MAVAEFQSPTQGQILFYSKCMYHMKNESLCDQAGTSRGLDDHKAQNG